QRGAQIRWRSDWFASGVEDYVALLEALLGRKPVGIHTHDPEPLRSGTLHLVGGRQIQAKGRVALPGAGWGLRLPEARLLVGIGRCRDGHRLIAAIAPDLQ